MSDSRHPEKNPNKDKSIQDPNIKSNDRPTPSNYDDKKPNRDENQDIENP